MQSSRWDWKQVDLPPDLPSQGALRFEIGCYEAGLATCGGGGDHSGDGDAASEAHRIDLLIRLGDLYARAGEPRKGLEVDGALVRLRPHEPIFRYNLACSHSRLGDLDQALRALDDAVRLGYSNVDHLLQDQDLDNLRADERFHRLLRRLAPPT